MRRTIGAAALIAMTALLPAGAAAQQSFGDAQGIGGGMGAGQYLPNQPGQMGGQQPQPGFGGQPTQFNGQQGEFGGQQGQANQFGGQQWQPAPSGNQFGGQNAQPGQFGGQQGQPVFGGQQGQPGFGGQPEQPGGYAGQYGGQPGQFGGQPGQPGQMGSPSGAFGGQAGQPGQNAGTGAPAQFSQMLDQLAQFERQDFGVPATDQLHQGPMHGPTPASIPGGQVITTKGLVELVQSQQTPYLLFDVLGSGETLPGAIPAAQASTPGSFNDQVSQQMGQYLQQATRGNTQIPLVFYCASVECWMSYNAALRAIKLGYSNVLWYRGGLAAWKSIGAPTVAAGAAWQGGQPGQGTQ